MNQSSPQMPDHQPLYDLAEAYDIAFDFRDLQLECDSLDAICRKFRGANPASFLDIPCGPGYHCIEYAKRGIRSCALDLSAAMLAHARRKAEMAAVSIEFIQGDMRDFTLNQPVDLALCATSTFQYLLTNADIVTHLKSVARNLTMGGLYLVEATHPRDVFRVGQSLKHEWEDTRDGTIIRTRWGDDDDLFDPITQINQTNVHMEIERDDQRSQHTHVDTNRSLTYQEFSLLIDQVPELEAVTWLGLLNVDQPFDSTEQSLRMVPVLRRL